MAADEEPQDKECLGDSLKPWRLSKLQWSLLKLAMADGRARPKIPIRVLPTREAGRAMKDEQTERYAEQSSVWSRREPKPGDKLVTRRPLDIADDLQWPKGTIVEVDMVVESSFEARDDTGVLASFANTDIYQNRWFDYVGDIASTDLDSYDRWLKLLGHVTLTGIDASTDLDQLPDHVELGILYAAKPQGRPRYPARSKLVKMLQKLQGRKLALHVCGEEARQELLNYNLADMTHLVQRIQVNGPWSTHYLNEVCARYSDHEIVTQYNLRTSSMTHAVNGNNSNHAVLVDNSGGRGIRPDSWRRPDVLMHVGFAGGIGPDNVVDVLMQLSVGRMERPGWWIDMEGGLRNEDDLFDVGKARAVVDNLREGCE